MDRLSKRKEETESARNLNCFEEIADAFALFLHPWRMLNSSVVKVSDS